MTSTVITRPEIETEFATIVDELTRRGFLAGGLGSAALLGLDACGSSTEGDAEGSSPQATTRQVDSVNGIITVPVTPKRVVSLFGSVDGTLYDVGIEPVGVYDQGVNWVSPRYRSTWVTAAKVGQGDLDLEKVAVLKPDLIIGADVDWNTDKYVQLTKIAPTVICPMDDWMATAAAVAEAVNQAARLAAVRQQVGDRNEEIKNQYADLLERLRWDLVRGGDTGLFTVYCRNTDICRVLTAAGVQLASASATDTDVLTPSYEELQDELGDADILGYYTYYDGSPVPGEPELFAQKLWKELPAVKAKRLVALPDFLPDGYGDVLSLLDELESGLKKVRENA